MENQPKVYEILGETFLFRTGPGELEEDAVKAVRLVEQEVANIQSKQSLLNDNQAAILVALNLAHRLVKQGQEYTQGLRELQNSAQKTLQFFKEGPAAPPS